MQATLSGHWRILRVSHWVKNVFVLPGTVVALSLDRHRLGPQLIWSLVAGLLACGLVASSNYVLNEILDAPYDRLHPTKRLRAVPAGAVSIPLAYVQWLVVGLCGIALGWRLSNQMALVLLVFWLMGWLYNIPPMRLKDLPYIDVVAEGFNNPLRLLAGWYLTGTQATPTTTLLLSYWLAGCYFMTVKRLAEYRLLGDAERSSAYRRSFTWYTESHLLVATVFYASATMLFFGAFLMRYRMELVLAFPSVAWVMAAYLALVFQPDSAAQRPEKLYREPKLMIAILVCAAMMLLLLFVDIPELHEWFPPTAIR
jgi:decaprenyl-phosphate phosphoribosyltransferase